MQDPASLERTYEQSGHNRKQTNWFSIEEHFGKRQLQKEWVENFKLEGLASDTKLSFLLKCSPTWSQKHLFVCLFVCFLAVVVEDSKSSNGFLWFFFFFFFFWSGGLTELVSTFTNSELENVALYFFFMCVSFSLTAGLAAYTWNTLRAWKRFTINVVNNWFAGLSVQFPHDWFRHLSSIWNESELHSDEHYLSSRENKT